MAVLCTCSSGWFVSHSKLVESWFKVLNTAGETSPSSMKLRDVFFDVKTPFRMDSAATKEASSFGMNDDTPVAKTKKRKRHLIDDVPLTDFVQAGSWIERASCEIVEAALAAGHLERSRPTREEIARNNREAREAAARVAASSTMTAPGAVPSSVRGHAATATVVRYQGAPFLVPAGARAQIGDIVQLGPCLTGNYDVILLDPPWENKSAARKRSYSTLNCDELFLALPLPRLFTGSCLVAVWCTVNAAHLDFVVHRLLPSWRLPYQTTWYWVKVTKRGEPVRPFCCPHKKPFEFVVFGGTTAEPLPRDKVFVSVPSTVHSHKPPLAGM